MVVEIGPNLSSAIQMVAAAIVLVAVFWWSAKR